MTITVRQVPLTPTLQLLVGQAHKECFPYDYDYIPTAGYWWLAYHGEHLAGFAGVTKSRQWGGTGYLCRAGVLPEYRGQGLQKRLIQARLAKAKRLGWFYCITDTRRNPASANSLISSGFRMYTPRNPWSFNDALYWRIKLT